MTLILGVEDPAKGRAFVFSDAGIWRKGEHYSICAKPKLWRNRLWICGASGDWELVQAAQRVELPLRERELTEADATVALLDWQKEVYRASSEIASLVKGVDHESGFSTPTMIVARGARVFDCVDCGVVRTTRGWAAAGYWTYAASAIEAIRLAGTLDAFNSGALTMRAVAAVTDKVLGPFRWMCTDGTGGEF